MTLLKVRDRGQITLPKSIRQSAKINTNTPLVVQIIGQIIILSPVRSSRLVTLQKKIVQLAEKKGITLDKLLKELKRERRTFNQRYYGI